MTTLSWADPFHDSRKRKRRPPTGRSDMSFFLGAFFAIVLLAGASSLRLLLPLLVPGTSLFWLNLGVPLWVSFAVTACFLNGLTSGVWVSEGLAKCLCPTSPRGLESLVPVEGLETSCPTTIGDRARGFVSCYKAETSRGVICWSNQRLLHGLLREELGCQEGRFHETKCWHGVRAFKK